MTLETQPPKKDNDTAPLQHTQASAWRKHQQRETVGSKAKKQNDTVDRRNTTPVVIYKYMLCNRGNHGIFTLSTGATPGDL